MFDKKTLVEKLVHKANLYKGDGWKVDKVGYMVVYMKRRSKTLALRITETGVFDSKVY